MAFLNGRRVTDLELHVPPAGGWIGNVTLDGDPLPTPGPCVITVGDLSLVGAVLPGRGGHDAPARPRLTIAGGYGWRTLLPAPGASYSSATGVRLTTVIRDIAVIAGETYVAPTETLILPGYGWDASAPTRPIRCDAVLADLRQRGAIPTWHVLPAGPTTFSAWPALPSADALGTIEDRDLDRGIRYLALSTSVAAFLPGATLEGATIGRLILEEHDSALRARVRDR